LSAAFLDFSQEYDGTDRHAASNGYRNAMDWIHRPSTTLGDGGRATGSAREQLANGSMLRSSPAIHEGERHALWGNKFFQHHLWPNCGDASP
jgi:hypothetical protein